MAKNKRHIVNRIEAPDYGDPWINRLALMLAIIKNMDDREREATLAFITSKYTF